MRALIIENNHSYREMLEHTLAQQGFEADTGDSIEFATEHYQPGFRFAF
jgi:DNA-binding response OmpR family regulator